MQTISAFQKNDARTYTLRESMSVFQADVYRLSIDGSDYAVKDFSRSPLLLKVLVLRRVLNREYRILKNLQTINGIPRAGDFLDKDKFTLEYITGNGAMPRTTEQMQAWGIGLSFFREIRRIVDEMHHAGVVHGDIRRRNILVGAKGPYLIDFATALQAGKAPGLIRKQIYRTVRRVDRLKVMELQEAYFPGHLTTEEEDELNHPPLLLACGRFLRRRIYRPFIKPEHWRKRWCSLKQSVLDQ